MKLFDYLAVCSKNWGMSLLLLILALFTLVSCASNTRSVDSITTGNYLLDIGNYETATGYFYVALQEASNEQEKATAMYGLGRANAYLCKFNEAESWILKSINIQELLPDKPSKNTWLTQNYFELARLYYENKSYQNAVKYFDKAIILVEKMNVEHEDPIGYSNVLVDYAESLDKVGEKERYKNISNKIKSLKEENPNKTSVFTIKRFNSSC